MTFYGVGDTADLDRIADALKVIDDIYHKYGRSTFFGDNLVALQRVLSFAHDERFRAAYDANAGDENTSKMWRVHTYCWAARSALSVPGDFVECGVYKGFYAGVLTDYLAFRTRAKEFYLYDTFEGLVEEWSEESERDSVNPHFDWVGTHEAVVSRFAPYPNVHVVKGVVPDVLEQQAPEHIAFLHLDLNAALAEVAALDKLAERLSDGAIVLMDDYGRQDNLALHRALNDWWRTHGYEVLELPTGQGLVIIREQPQR